MVGRIFGESLIEGYCSECKARNAEGRERGAEGLFEAGRDAHEVQNRVALARLALHEPCERGDLGPQRLRLAFGGGMGSAGVGLAGGGVATGGIVAAASSLRPRRGSQHAPRAAASPAPLRLPAFGIGTPRAFL